jgi:CubicO group peptidase (beta-lactamase class C family)
MKSIRYIPISLFASIIALCAFTGCKTSHYRPAVYSYSKPPLLNDGIVVDNLDTLKSDSSKIIQLTKLILADSFPNIHSLLIMKDNKLIYEHYFAGYDQNNGKNLGYIDHGASDLHDCRSITKSVVSACIGIAIEHKFIGSIDEPVFNYFPEYSRYNDSIKSKITIRHLLTMTSGLSWNEYISYSNPLNSEVRMNLTVDPIGFILNRDTKYKPGSYWVYSGGNTQILAEIIKKTSGMPIDKFAEKYLFAPLCIKKFEWNGLFFKKSMPSAASGLRLTSRDMLKIGMLYMNDGNWNKQHVLTKAWANSSLSTHVARNELKLIKKGGYGYQFWTYQETINKQTYDITEAKGNGGNAIFFCKSLRLVVVITAGNYNNWKIKNNTYAAFCNYILPAFL